MTLGPAQLPVSSNLNRVILRRREYRLLLKISLMKNYMGRSVTVHHKENAAHEFTSSTGRSLHLLSKTYFD
jgi:hypothetical protein